MLVCAAQLSSLPLTPHCALVRPSDVIHDAQRRLKLPFMARAPRSAAVSRFTPSPKHFQRTMPVYTAKPLVTLLATITPSAAIVLIS